MLTAPSSPRTHTLLLAERTFFGVAARQRDATANRHGCARQHRARRAELDPTRRREPLTYYYRSGPIGQVFAALGAPTPARVAVVGSAPDPGGVRRARPALDVLRDRSRRRALARDIALFTYLDGLRRGVRRRLGDARLSLAGAPQTTT